MCALSVVFGARDETVYRTVVAVGRFTNSIALLLFVSYEILNPEFGGDLVGRSPSLSRARLKNEALWSVSASAV